MTEELEKRRHKRVDAHIPVKYRALNSGAGVKGEKTLIENISASGVRFMAAEFISIATRLIIELNVPLISKPVKAISKIAWISRVPGEDNFEVGSYFLEMSRSDREVVSKYIDNVVINGEKTQ